MVFILLYSYVDWKCCICILHCLKVKCRRQCKGRAMKKNFGNLNMNTCKVSADLRSAGQNQPCYKGALRENGMCL